MVRPSVEVGLRALGVRTSRRRTPAATTARWRRARVSGKSSGSRPANTNDQPKRCGLGHETRRVDELGEAGVGHGVADRCGTGSARPRARVPRRRPGTPTRRSSPSRNDPPGSSISVEAPCRRRLDRRDVTLVAHRSAGRGRAATGHERQSSRALRLRRTARSGSPIRRLSRPYDPLMPNTASAARATAAARHGDPAVRVGAGRTAGAAADRHRLGHRQRAIGGDRASPSPRWRRTFEAELLRAARCRCRACSNRCGGSPSGRRVAYAVVLFVVAFAARPACPRS